MVGFSHKAGNFKDIMKNKQIGINEWIFFKIVMMANLSVTLKRDSHLTSEKQSF